MRIHTFDRIAEAEARHAVLFSRLLDQVVHLAPGLPGYSSVIELVDGTEIQIRSQFADGEGVHVITQRIQVNYSIVKIPDL